MPAEPRENNAMERCVGLTISAAIEAMTVEHAGRGRIGDELQSMEKAASERSRPPLSPAASTNVAPHHYRRRIAHGAGARFVK